MAKDKLTINSVHFFDAICREKRHQSRWFGHDVDAVVVRTEIKVGNYPQEERIQAESRPRALTYWADLLLLNDSHEDKTDANNANTVFCDICKTY